MTIISVPADTFHINAMQTTPLKSDEWKLNWSFQLKHLLGIKKNKGSQTQFNKQLGFDL